VGSFALESAWKGGADIPFDLLFGVLVGLCFAAAAQVQFREGRSPWGRELLAVLSFEGIVAWPTTAYFYLVHPDWSWMYLLDPASLPRGLLALVLAAHAVALVGGYLLGWWMIRRWGQRGAWGAPAGAALVLIIGVLIGHARIFRYGTYASFHRGQWLPLREVKLGWVFAPILLGIAVAVVAVGWTLYSQGRRAVVSAKPARPGDASVGT
jgi:hypothetical protein